MRSHPIGTGPFKSVEFKPNESIKLTRNPDYWPTWQVPKPIEQVPDHGETVPAAATGMGIGSLVIGGPSLVEASATRSRRAQDKQRPSPGLRRRAARSCR